MSGRSASIPAGFAAVLICAVLAASPRPAPASLSSLNLDHLAVAPGGRHHLWVSVLDASGRPRRELSPGDFSVTEDLSPIEGLSVQSYSDRYRSSDIALLIDPGLISELGTPALAAIIERLLDRLGPGDRLRVVAAGEGFPDLELAPGVVPADLASRLEAVASPSSPRPLEAVFREVRRARRVARDRGSVILVATRGADRGSAHGVLPVLALLRAMDRPAAISVLLWEGADERAVEQLGRLSQQSGGGFQRVSSTHALGRGAVALVDRSRGAYFLSFRPDGWDAGAERHHIRVTVREGGIRRWADREFVTDDVLVTPWWAYRPVWLGAAGFLLLAGAGAWALRPRCIARLTVEDGSERGCSYEVFGVPLTFGAALGNDIILPEARVSRNHAMLERRRGVFALLDLNSENGTFVNGERVTRRQLSPGDHVSFGGAVSLRFQVPTALPRRPWTRS